MARWTYEQQLDDAIRFYRMTPAQKRAYVETWASKPEERPAVRRHVPSADSDRPDGPTDRRETANSLGRTPKP